MRAARSGVGFDRSAQAGAWSGRPWWRRRSCRGPRGWRRRWRRRWRTASRPCRAGTRRRRGPPCPCRAGRRRGARRRGAALRGGERGGARAGRGERADDDGGGVGVAGAAGAVAPAAVLVLHGLQPGGALLDRLVGLLGGRALAADGAERLDGDGGGVGVPHRLRVAGLRGVRAVGGEGAVVALLAEEPLHGLVGGLVAGGALGEEGERLAPDAVVGRVLRAVQAGRELPGGGGRGGAAEACPAAPVPSTAAAASAAAAARRTVFMGPSPAAGHGTPRAPGSAPYSSTVPAVTSRPGHSDLPPSRRKGGCTAAGQYRISTGFPVRA